MQIVSIGDNMHEMSNPIFCFLRKIGKNISKCLLKILPQVLSVKGNRYSFKKDNSKIVYLKRALLLLEQTPPYRKKKKKKKKIIVQESEKEIIKPDLLVKIGSKFIRCILFT